MKKSSVSVWLGKTSRRELRVKGYQEFLINMLITIIIVVNFCWELHNVPGIKWSLLRSSLSPILSQSH